MNRVVEVDGVPYNTAGYQMITSAQAAAIFGVPTSAVSRWARSGSIPFTRLPNGHLRFSKDWCVGYMRNQGGQKAVQAEQEAGE